MKLVDELIEIAKQFVPEKAPIVELSVFEQFAMDTKLSTGPNEFPVGLLWDYFRLKYKNRERIKFFTFLSERYEHFKHGNKTFYLLNESTMALTKQEMMQKVGELLYAQRKKGKTKKRDRVKYPGLDKSVNSRTRQDLIDFDYLDKLNENDKEWLNRFSKEYIGASFEKTKSKKQYSKKNLHKTAKQRRQIYAQNNARNRCAQTIAQATGFLVNEEVAWEVYENEQAKNYNNDQEEAMIALIESKGRFEKED